MSRTTARALAAGAIAAQVLFVVAWIVAGALDDGYSHMRDGVSVLGASDSENPLIVNAAIVLFVAAGAVTAAAGFLPVDCSLADETCEDAWRAGELSWQHDAHLWLGLAGGLLIAALPFAIAAALRPG